MRVPLLLGCLVGFTALSAMAEDDAAMRARYEKELAGFNEIAKKAEEERLQGVSPEVSKNLETIVDGLSSKNWFIPGRARELLMPYVQNGWMAVGHFDRLARAAEEKRSHDKLSGDRHLVPIVEALSSSNIAIRDRAVELMIPYVRDGWIAVEQFERVTWEKLDARGRGLFLWCAASRHTWGEEPLGHPLSPEVTVRLWKKASDEPVPLPFLKGAAQTWLPLRGSNSDPIRLGEHLQHTERGRIARQYLSVFRTCTTPRECFAVVWMILDLHVELKDTALTEWYAVEADPALRASLLHAMHHAVRAPLPTDGSYESRAAEKGRDAVRARLPVILALLELAEKDWHPESKAAADRVKEAVAAYQQ